MLQFYLDGVDPVIDQSLCLCDLILKLRLIHRVCRFKSRLGCVDQVSQARHCRCKLFTGRGLEICDRIVQVCLYLRHLSLKHRVCVFDLAVQLGLESRICFACRLLCIGNCLFQRFDCILQCLCICRIGRLQIFNRRFNFVNGLFCLGHSCIKRIDQLVCLLDLGLQQRILLICIRLCTVDQPFQLRNGFCKLIGVIPGRIIDRIVYFVRCILDSRCISIGNIAFSRIDCRCKLCVGCAVLFKRGDLCGDFCKLCGNVCCIRLVCNKIVQLVNVRFKLCDISRKVNHTNIKREGEHLGCAIVAARMGDYGNHQLILAADHCGGRYGYFESVDIASKVADLCAFDSDKIGEHLVLDARQGVGKENGVTGENRGNGRSHVQGRRCSTNRDGDILHCNAFVIVIACDPVQHAIGACAGLSLGVRAGTNDFFPNALGNSNAIILTAIYCILHGSAGSRARGCDCLHRAVVDQILNRGGRGHNRSRFCDGKAADLKVGHSLVVSALGDTDLNGISACVGRAFHLAAVLVILDGDLSHTEDAVFRFDKRRLCGAVVDCAVGHSAAEIVCLWRCLLNGIGHIHTARVVALAHNRDGVTAGTDRHTVPDTLVIHTVLKRNAAHSDYNGGSLCRAVIFGFRYGDNSIFGKIRALLYGKVFHLIFVKIGDYRAGIDDLTVLVVEIIVLGENVRRGLSG